MWLIGDSGYLLQKVLYNALSLVYMAVCNLVIKVVVKVTSYKLNFQNRHVNLSSRFKYTTKCIEKKFATNKNSSPPPHQISNGTSLMLTVD